MFCTYVLKSKKTSKHYIGHCADLDDRMKRHNDGRSVSTKSGVPWELIYFEEFETRSLAVKREKQIKSYKNGTAFKKLVNTSGCGSDG
jgi:putative endonuclease